MTRLLTKTGLTLAMLAAAAVAGSGSAGAAMHHKKTRMAAAKKVRLVPAQLKPTYHGFPGYAGGGPGMAPPMLIDIPQVAPGGGVLGIGLVPSTGVFRGVPLLGEFGL